MAKTFENLIVGILSFMSRINFTLSSVEHERSFITSRLTVQSITFVLPEAFTWAVIVRIFSPEFDHHNL